jgi:hypothetical protein
MKLTIQIIADILQNALQLDSEHISIYNQRNPIPVDDKLFVSVGMMGWQVFGNNKKYNGTSGLVADASQYIQELISIEAFSRSTEAIRRVPEIVGAFNTTYATQQQETIGFKLATVPMTMNDTSFLEGTSILYRVSMTVRVLRAYSKQDAVEYYDTFSRETYTEKGEFE